MNLDTEEYEEHILYSAGHGVVMMPHHIMKITSGKFNVKNLVKPVTMVRKPLKDDKEEEDKPQGGYFFKKKSKALFLGKEDEDIVLGEGEKKIATGALIAPIGSRHGDPDKSPWIFKDAEDHHFIGSLEGSQNANHVLLLPGANGFKVIPVSKWYKFNPKLTHRVLTIDEAEERMKKQKANKSDRWIMKEDGQKLIPLKTEKPKKKWMEKLLNLEEEQLNVTKKKNKKEKNYEDIGMDYDELFEDDEEVNLGMDDVDEAKEAQRRVHQDEEDGDDLWGNTVAKKIAKSLAKRENLDVYDDFGPENPYWSDEDDDQEKEKLETQTNALLEKVKKATKVSSVPGSPKTDGGIKMKPSLSDEQPAKKQKLDLEDSAPPPPSAAEVVARQIEKERRRKVRSGSRGPSASPAPSSPRTPPSVAPSTPQPSDGDPNLMTEDDLLRVVKLNGEAGITVKQIVQELKSWFTTEYSEKNKDKMRQLMRKCLDLDKQTKKLTIKPEYQDWKDPKQ